MKPRFPTNAKVRKFTATLWLNVETPLMTRQFDCETQAFAWVQKFNYTATIDLNV